MDDARSLRSAVEGVDAVVHAAGLVKVVRTEDGEAYPFDEVIRHTERAVGRRALRVPLPLPIVKTVFRANELIASITRRPAILRADKIHEIRTRSWHMDTTPLREELGWEPRVKYAEGARLAVEWYRKNGWL